MMTTMMIRRIIIVRVRQSQIRDDQSSDHIYIYILIHPLGLAGTDDDSSGDVSMMTNRIVAAADDRDK